VFDAVSDAATVVGYDDNRGKGHALKWGLDCISRRYPEDATVVTVDADGQHSSSDVLRCAELARTSGDDTLVLGCRSFSGADVPLRSRVGNLVTRGVFRLASGVRVSDTQTGLRAFSAHLIPFLRSVTGERYEYEMNVLLACPEQGVTLAEVPIRSIYVEGNAASHFRPLCDSLRIYLGILSFAASSLTGFLVDYLLFWVLSSLLAALGAAGVVAANAGARLVSAAVNFLINHRLVFHSGERLSVTARRYALLALGILAANTAALLTLTDVLRMPALPAKLMVEIGFFLVSWVVQSRLVFRRRCLLVAPAQA
jgi:putative flippase GtrA